MFSALLENYVVLSGIVYLKESAKVYTSVHWWWSHAQLGSACRPGRVEGPLLRALWAVFLPVCCGREERNLHSFNPVSKTPATSCTIQQVTGGVWATGASPCGRLPHAAGLLCPSLFQHPHAGSPGGDPGPSLWKLPFREAQKRRQVVAPPHAVPLYPCCVTESHCPSLLPVLLGLPGSKQQDLVLMSLYLAFCNLSKVTSPICMQRTALGGKAKDWSQEHHSVCKWGQTYLLLRKAHSALAFPLSPS